MSHFHLMRRSIEESVDAIARGGLKRSLKHVKSGTCFLNELIVSQKPPCYFDCHADQFNRWIGPFNWQSAWRFCSDGRYRFKGHLLYYQLFHSLHIMSSGWMDQEQFCDTAWEIIPWPSETDRDYRVMKQQTYIEHSYDVGPWPDYHSAWMEFRNNYNRVTEITA